MRGLAFHRRQKSLTPCQARGDEVRQLIVRHVVGMLCPLSSLAALDSRNGVAIEFFRQQRFWFPRPVKQSLHLRIERIYIVGTDKPAIGQAPYGFRLFNRHAAISSQRPHNVNVETYHFCSCNVGYVLLQTSYEPELLPKPHCISFQARACFAAAFSAQRARPGICFR